jgi:hypothetical protein
MIGINKREFALMAITAAITAGVMYVAWQADRAQLALRLSQVQVRAMKAEGVVEELQLQRESARRDDE